jgi:hypothetical protein
MSLQMPGWFCELSLSSQVKDRCHGWCWCWFIMREKYYYFIEIVRLISLSEQDIAANLWLHPVTLPPLNNESQWSSCNRTACTFWELCHAGNTTCWVVSARVVIRGGFRGQDLLSIPKDKSSAWYSFLWLGRRVLPFLYRGASSHAISIRLPADATCNSSSK